VRVLHVGKFFPPVTGGIENFLGDLLPALSRAGITAAGLVHDDSCGGVGEPAWNERLNIYRVPCYGTLLYAPVSPMFPWIMQKTIDAFQPDILHFHVPNTSAFWALTLPTARRLPWVIHWHADVVPSAIDRRMAIAYHLYRPVEALLLRRAQAVITTSESYLTTSCALSGYRDKCRVVPLGLDSRRLKLPDAEAVKWADAQWGKPDGRILVIGRLTYYKGHDVMLDAAAALPDVRIIMVGDGDRESFLECRVREKGLGSRVSLLKAMPESALHALLASCDCLCLPSVERTEAFGLVLLEAMRYGKPVVASDIPGSGIGWVVNDGVTGYLTVPGDPTSLADAIQRMFKDPKRRLQMGKNAQERFFRVFQIDHVAQDVILVYDQIMKASSPRYISQHAGMPSE
jgi:rhamnosyl/mannosyltransferase